MSMTGKRDRVSNFYHVSIGKIRKNLGKTAPESMEGVTERVNAKSETVFEIVSDYIAGKVVAMTLEKPEEGKEEFGKRIAMTLENGNDKAIVYMKWDSAYGRGFMFASPNIDFAEEIELEPYSYEQKGSGKKKIGLSVIQNGKQVDWGMGTKSNPGGCPSLEKVVYKGKEEWDNTKQLAFLEERFEQLAAQVAALNSEPINNVDDAEYFEAEEVEDDAEYFEAEEVEDDGLF